MLQVPGIHSLRTKQRYFSLERPDALTGHCQTMCCCSSYCECWSKSQCDGHFEYSTATLEKVESNLSQLPQILRSQRLSICASVSSRALLPQNSRWHFNHLYLGWKGSICSSHQWKQNAWAHLLSQDTHSRWLPWH